MDCLLLPGSSAWQGFPLMGPAVNNRLRRYFDFLSRLPSVGLASGASQARICHRQYLAPEHE